MARRDLYHWSEGRKVRDLVNSTPVVNVRASEAVVGAEFHGDLDYQLAPMGRDADAIADFVHTHFCTDWCGKSAFADWLHTPLCVKRTEDALLDQERGEVQS